MPEANSLPNRIQPVVISRYYDIESAFYQLNDWGWNEMYPSRKLTKTMVEKWAKGHKHGWRLHKAMRKMVVSEQNLMKILKGH
ncbi:hypothetical protein [Reichenbachiella sp.]|uniref:hypothetical protein n=1 Tax=Reichenbachiella sp. TaxID=2184521 RepID=UPI0032982720